MSLEDEIKNILAEYLTFKDEEYSPDLQLIGCGDIFDATEALTTLSRKYRIEFPDEFLVNYEGVPDLTPRKIIAYIHSHLSNNNP